MCGREAQRVATGHPKKVEFEFKGSRKTRLVTGNIVDFILAKMGQFSILFEAISNFSFELHWDWNIGCHMCAILVS